MPEGHVIHRLAAELEAAFSGRAVQVSSPQGRFADAAGLLDGMVFGAAQAFGKHLVLDFGQSAEASGEAGRASEANSSSLVGSPGPFVHIHLGLIGKLRWVDPESVDSVDTLRLRIATDDAAVELRGPQTCALVGAEEVVALAKSLGPDPLRADADPEQGWRRVHGSARSIAALLMDQRVTAGVGNIYRAEVLFRQRVNPDTPGRELSRQKWLRIWADLVELMRQGVRDGRIDTVRPEHLPEAMGREPRLDPHGGEVYVYRRSGQPCLVCGREIGVRSFEGRNLYWCARCQRRR